MEIKGRQLDVYCMLESERNAVSRVAFSNEYGVDPTSPKGLLILFDKYKDPIGKPYLHKILRELTAKGLIIKDSLNARRCTYRINNKLLLKEGKNFLRKHFDIKHKDYGKGDDMMLWTALENTCGSYIDLKYVDKSYYATTLQEVWKDLLIPNLINIRILGEIPKLSKLLKRKDDARKEAVAFYIENRIPKSLIAED